MRQTWFPVIGLILIILVTGCTTSPNTSPVITPSTPIAGAVAKTGDTVSVFYTGTLDDGTVFDTNVNETPLEFTLGTGMVIPGFEDAVLGMGINESKTVFIPYGKAYGSYNASLVHTVDRSILPANMTPVAGQYLTITRKTDGAVSRVKIINVTPSSITWDENSDLAGKNLTFSIRLAGIR